MKKSKIEKIEKCGLVIGLLSDGELSNCGNADNIYHNYYCFYDNHSDHVPYIVLDYKKLSDSERLILTCRDQDLVKLFLVIIINQKPELVIGCNNLQTIKEFLL